MGWGINMKNLTSLAADFPLLEFLSLKVIQPRRDPSNDLKELTLECLPALKQLGNLSSIDFCSLNHFSSIFEWYELVSYHIGGTNIRNFVKLLASNCGVLLFPLYVKENLFIFNSCIPFSNWPRWKMIH